MKLMHILNEIILENSNNLTVYHGTNPSSANKIKNIGLESSKGYDSGKWYMVSTDFESALFHAKPDNEGGNVSVVELQIPITGEKWSGFPYLWRGLNRSGNSTWFALREKIPANLVKKVHTIQNDKWVKQKSEKF